MEVSGGSCSSRAVLPSATPRSRSLSGPGALYADLAAGFISGCASRTMTAPAERLKTELQLQTGPSQSLIAVSRRVLAEGGSRAFFQGNVVNCAKVAPQSALFFAATDYFKQVLPTRCDASYAEAHSFLCGTLAGIISQLLVYPMEPVKTCMTVAPRSQYAGTFDCARKMVRAGGFRALYRGAGPTLAGCVPYAGAQRLVYDRMQHYLSSRQRAASTAHEQALSTAAHLWCGLVSSSVGMAVAYPLVLVRTRLQVQGNLPGREREAYTGMIDCFKKTVAREGFGGLMKGFLPNLLKAAPAAAINFALYEYTKDAILNRCS